MVPLNGITDNDINRLMEWFSNWGVATLFRVLDAAKIQLFFSQSRFLKLRLGFVKIFIEMVETTRDFQDLSRLFKIS